MVMPPIFLALAFGLASTATAQTAELTLLDESTRTPIAGAIVRLMGQGRAVAQGLSNEQGRIALKPPAPGTYQIRIDRIGFSGLSLDEVRIEPNAVLRRILLLPHTRMELPPIVVNTRTSCDASGDGGLAAAALWREVEKALAANVITQQGGEYPLRVREFRRVLTRSLEPLAEQETRAAIVSGAPFWALPASVLAKRGFVTEDFASSEVTFAVPDAATLLSDEFVSTHCFRVASVGDSLIGLSFEPARGRWQSDVKGTLWMRRATLELEHLEYSYVQVASQYRRPELGGRVEFTALPSGAWIISYWYVRMPSFRQGTMGRSAPMGAEYVEHGGRAELAASRRPRQRSASSDGG